MLNVPLSKSGNTDVISIFLWWYLCAFTHVSEDKVLIIIEYPFSACYISINHIAGLLLVMHLSSSLIPWLIEMGLILLYLRRCIVVCKLTNKYSCQINVKSKNVLISLWKIVERSTGKWMSLCLSLQIETTMKCVCAFLVTFPVGPLLLFSQMSALYLK